MVYWIEGNKTLHRSTFIRGQQTGTGSAHLSGKDDFNFRIEITSAFIELQDASGKVLDHIDRPNPDDLLGTTGFRGEIRLSLHEPGLISSFSLPE